MHSDTHVMSCLSNCFTPSQNQVFFLPQFSQQGLPSLEKMKLSAISLYIITNNKHARIRTCILLSVHCWWQGKKTAWCSLVGLTPSPGSSGEKICILTGSKLRKHDMESGRGCRSVSGVWFFNRLTFRIWGKSQQLSGQNFYNCPSGRADVWLEIVLPFYLICSGFCIQMVCFLSPGNGDFSPFLSCLPHFLSVASKTVVGTIGV